MRGGGADANGTCWPPRRGRRPSGGIRPEVRALRSWPIRATGSSTDSRVFAASQVTSPQARIELRRDASRTLPGIAIKNCERVIEFQALLGQRAQDAHRRLVIAAHLARTPSAVMVCARAGRRTRRRGNEGITIRAAGSDVPRSSYKAIWEAALQRATSANSVDPAVGPSTPTLAIIGTTSQPGSDSIGWNFQALTGAAGSATRRRHV